MSSNLLKDLLLGIELSLGLPFKPAQGMLCSQANKTSLAGGKDTAPGDGFKGDRSWLDAHR